MKLKKRTASTVEEIVGIALEHIPNTFAGSDFSPGRKIFFPIPMKKYPKGMADFLYVYAESKLVGDPKDDISGFTDLDVVDETGIYMFSQAKGSECISRQTYSLESLLEIVKDISIRHRIIHRIAEMRNMVHLDEMFLEVANIEWTAAKTYRYAFGVQRLQ